MFRLCVIPRSGYDTGVQVMVISLGEGTHVFQLDRALGEFVLTKRNITMPARGTCGRVKRALDYRDPHRLFIF